MFNEHECITVRARDIFLMAGGAASGKKVDAGKTASIHVLKVGEKLRVIRNNNKNNLIILVGSL